MLQNSEEWRLARCGSVGASRIADIISRTKGGGYSTSRQNYLAELVAERLTGIPIEGYVNAHMARGLELEPAARRLYAFERDAEVIEVGLIPHPRIVGSHASPDGFVMKEGLVEIKCPLIATHLHTLLTGEIKGEYVSQMQWQLACTERLWCDFVSYSPLLPDAMQLFIKRVRRDDDYIGTLESEVEAFLSDLEDVICDLQRRYETVG